MQGSHGIANVSRVSSSVAMSNPGVSAAARPCLLASAFVRISCGLTGEQVVVVVEPAPRDPRQACVRHQINISATLSLRPSLRRVPPLHPLTERARLVRSEEDAVFRVRPALRRQFVELLDAVDLAICRVARNPRGWSASLPGFSDSQLTQPGSSCKETHEAKAKPSRGWSQR